MAKHPGGRPTKYTEALAKQICHELSQGDLLPDVLNRHKDDPTWPRETAVYSWLVHYPEFAKQYAYAKQGQIEALVMRAFLIARDKSGDIMIDKDGDPHSDNTAVQRHRLEIDTIKWYASKVVPKVYGDKMHTELSNKEGEEFKAALTLLMPK